MEVTEKGWSLGKALGRISKFSGFIKDYKCSCGEEGSRSLFSISFVCKQCSKQEARSLKVFFSFPDAMSRNALPIRGPLMDPAFSAIRGYGSRTWD